MEYLCYILSRIFSTCRKHFSVLSSLMTYHRVCNQINTMGVTSGAGTDYPSKVPGFTPVLVGFVLFDDQIYMYVLQIVVCTLYFFFWPLCCLFFFDIRILITPLVSLNLSYGPFKQIQMCRSFSLLAYIYGVVGDQIIKGPGGSMSQVVGLPNNSYKPITYVAWVRTLRCKLQKGCTRLRPQVIKFTSCLPIVGGYLVVLRLLPPLKLVSMIQLKYC